METLRLDDQTTFWSRWVDDSVAWETNPDNKRRALHVLQELKAFGGDLKHILNIGCGSGWLDPELSKYGKVTGIDLASSAMERLKVQYPHIDWIGGDFLTADLHEESFDFVVSLETIAHVYDQQAFANRISSHVRKGGLLVLTTQNEKIWTRTSTLKPPEPGQLRNWPSPERLEELFAANFDILKITTCAPGGNLGLPFFINNRITTILGYLIFGRERWIARRERWGFGRSLVLVARRK